MIRSRSKTPRHGLSGSKAESVRELPCVVGCYAAHCYASDELESLLREKEQESNSPSSSGSHPTYLNNSIDDLISTTQLNGAAQVSHTYGAGPSNVGHGQMMAIDPALQFQSGSPLDSLAGVASLLGAPVPSRITNAPSTSGQSDDSQIPSSGHGYDVTHTAWPRNLPNPTFLRHLYVRDRNL